jgi:hypothetical protein
MFYSTWWGVLSPKGPGQTQCVNFLMMSCGAQDAPACDPANGIANPICGWLRGRIDQIVELLKIHTICIRDGAEFCFALSPINPLKALPGPGAC